MDEISENERLRAALKVAHQALLEVKNAQEVGTSWYTRGEFELRSHVAMWVRKGLEAIRGAEQSQDGEDR